MKTDDGKIFDWLLSHKKARVAVVYHNFKEWKYSFFQNAGGWDAPADKAIAGGFIADCPAYAFWAGLQAGFQRLFKNMPEKCAAAFCVTESTGNHPRNIKSTIMKATDRPDNVLILNGEKHYISGAFEADIFFVAASEGTDSSGRNILKLAMLESTSPGISLNLMENLKILPEITHGIVAFNNVQLTENKILPGDAYSDYIKPFRTVEDLFVVSAILGYLYRLSRAYGWPRYFSGKIISFLVTARTLCVS
ncbi:MAG: acyl-CoA dehydrogenase family protein, partial [Spirochaetes bacterium]|nr:acyl-CoA dehydrogenase family protein [Spirochaetota bacterium]